MLNQVHTPTSTILLDMDGIIHVTMLAGSEQTLADAQETVRAAMTLWGSAVRPALIDMRAMKSQHRDARQYYGSAEVTNLTTAVALLGDSRVSMLVANFFLAITNPKIPTQLFTNEQAALAWLKGFLP